MAQPDYSLLDDVNVIIAIDFSISNACKSKLRTWRKSLHSQGSELDEPIESPYRRALTYIVKSLPNKQGDCTVGLCNFSQILNEMVQLSGSSYEMLSQALEKYDEWVKDFEYQLADPEKQQNMGTSITSIIVRALEEIYSNSKTTVLMILTDGGITDPCKEAHAVREASLHPLCISTIGITLSSDHPKFNTEFDPLYILDDNLFDRVFDNFTFTPFQYCAGQLCYYTGITDASGSAASLIHKQASIDYFMRGVLAELQEQKQTIEKLKYFDRDMGVFKKIFQSVDYNTLEKGGNDVEEQDAIAKSNIVAKMIESK